MSITVTLQATDDIVITSSDDIVLGGTTIDFYKSAAHHIKFVGYTQSAPGAVSGNVEVKCNGNFRKIFLTNNDDRIPLYWDPANVPLWVLGQWYAIGDLVQGNDATANKNIYRCKLAHSGADALRPPTGAQYLYYWDKRNDLDDGRKFIYINEYE